MAEGDPRVRIGKLLVKARSRAGLSQEALAAAIQEAGLPISASRLAAIEEGNRLPDTEVAAALAEVLGLDLRGFDLPQPRIHVLTGRAAPEPGDEPCQDMVRPSVLEVAPVPPIPPKRAERTKVADYPRLTVYIEPDTKALIEGTSRVLGIPVYQLLTAAFLEYYEGLAPSDRALIVKVADKRKAGDPTRRLVHKIKKAAGAPNP